MQSAIHSQGFGIGVSLLRKEDDPHLCGRGQFVSNIRLPGLAEVVFVRSPRARIRSIAVPENARGRVFTAADLPRMRPIRVGTQAVGAEVNETPLTSERVSAAIQRCRRYVQEANR